MRTIDSQLRGLYEVLGNGVLQGWEVGRSALEGMSVDITMGKGVISFVVVENTESTSLSTLFPNSTNYIYASKLPDSYWSRGVAFAVSLSEIANPDMILLSKVTTASTSITSIDNSVRKNIGLVSSVIDIVKNHRHLGGLDNPEPIDLSSQVQGSLSQQNLPDLDASKVTTGKLDKTVIPLVDHATGLTNIGELTHAQLDSFVQNLSLFGKTVMGETALVNLLQLTLALKHQWPEIDEYLVNQLAFIPGISPDSLIDFDNTTAEVDARTQAEGGLHRIYGSTGPGMRVFTQTWDSIAEFTEAEKDGTELFGNTIQLAANQTSVVLDDFEILGAWETKIEDLSSSAGSMELDALNKVSGGHSVKVGVNTLESSNIAFTMTKVFESQDWSEYDGLVFYIKTQDVEHGDVFFYINDDILGVQNSYTLILGRNEPTINRETLLNGWREIYIDLTPYNRSSINKMGFFMSTQHGWDAKRSFDLNVDKVTLTTGNRFVAEGNVRFVYGNGFPQDFWRARWDAVIPSGSVISVRSRVSNNLLDFEPESETPAQWSSVYTSSFELPTYGSNLYSYVQLEVSMTSSSDKKLSPTLMRLYLDRKASADDSSFVYNEQDSWESGIKTNIDTTSVPGSIKIASVTDIDNVFFGSTGTVEQTDSSFETVFSNAGTSIPISTRQALIGESSGFGQISAVKRGDNGTVWVADTDNDRVLQIDKSGNIVFGLWGSFLEGPFDGYGTEEGGPGSNIDYENIPPADRSEKVPIALYSIYNPNTNVLSVVFSQNLERVEDDSGTTLQSSKMILKIGSRRVYFGADTKFSLFGIDPKKDRQWAMSANPFIGQFTFQSHILQATLSQADSIAIESSTSMLIPSILTSGRSEQELVVDDHLLLSFITPNVLIGSDSVSNNGIRLRVNSGAYTYYRTSSILLAYPNISNGLNTIEASIVDGANNVFENSESSCLFSFILDPNGDEENEPRISISSPQQGQSISSSTVSIAFESHNHPILPVGSCIEYSIDSGSFQEYRSEEPIQVVGLSGGKHSVTIRLVDGSGNEINSQWSSATVSFNAGVSSTTDVSLLIGAGTIRGVSRSETTKTPEKIIPVSVGNIYMSNLYSPVDIQIIPNETSNVNPSGEETVLVAKLRSPSTTEYLSTSTAVGDNSIFESNYMDGHSVVQYSKTGEVLFSNNAAKFSDTKENAKSYLGSANKESASDLIIADSIRQRAIVARTDLETGVPKVIWEYTSDRLVSDFQSVSDKETTISIFENSSDLKSAYIKSGNSVIWTNKSSIPIKIVSGTTTPENFSQDPDLTLYGKEFISQELQPGEQYSTTFNNSGIYGWFAYPSIITGTIDVIEDGVSQSDNYWVVEKDLIPSIGGGRILKLDSWGNILFKYGEGMLYDPKDVRKLTGSSIIIST
jgi:hypothetical protein